MGLSSFMQRKSIGHSRRKQGEQGGLDLRISRRRQLPGAGHVSSGEVLPNIATRGVPTAAARCMGPVSLVTKAEQLFKAAASSHNEVCPARLIIGASKFQPLVIARIEVAISFVNGISPFPPKKMTPQPDQARASRIIHSKFSLGQRLAGPYSAPGLIPSHLIVGAS